MPNFRYFEWIQTDSHAFQAEHSNPNSTISHVKLAQDESLPRRERRKHALQVFEQRGRCSFTSSIRLGAVVVWSAYFGNQQLMKSGMNALAVACLFNVICYSVMVHDALMGVYVARQIAMSIKSSLDTKSDDLYLPSRSILQGRFMLSLRPPWFCEMKDQDDEEESSRGSFFSRVMCHRKWSDKASGSQPTPSTTELKLRIAADPMNTAHERADAALIVLSKRLRLYFIGAILISTYALLMGSSSLILLFYVAQGRVRIEATTESLLDTIWKSVLVYFSSYFSYTLSARAWVAYHIKSRIRKSVANSGLSEFPTASDCEYYIPSDTLLRKGFRIVKTYPFYDELAERVQVKQDKRDVDREEHGSKLA